MLQKQAEGTDEKFGRASFAISEGEHLQSQGMSPAYVDYGDEAKEQNPLLANNHITYQTVKDKE